MSTYLYRTFINTSGSAFRLYIKVYLNVHMHLLDHIYLPKKKRTEIYFCPLLLLHSMIANVSLETTLSDYQAVEMDKISLRNYIFHIFS